MFKALFKILESLNKCFDKETYLVEEINPSTTWGDILVELYNISEIESVNIDYGKFEAFMAKFKEVNQKSH